jgi:hypothetical protein
MLLNLIISSSVISLSRLNLFIEYVPFSLFKRGALRKEYYFHISDKPVYGLVTIFQCRTEVSVLFPVSTELVYRFIYLMSTSHLSSVISTFLLNFFPGSFLFHPHLTYIDPIIFTSVLNLSTRIFHERKYELFHIPTALTIASVV